MERNGDVLDSEMAGQIKLKLVGMVEGLWQNVMKEFIYTPRLGNFMIGPDGAQECQPYE